MRSVFKVVSAVLLAAYPIGVWAGISFGGGRVVGLVLLAGLAVVLPLRVRNRRQGRSPRFVGIGVAVAVLALLSILLDDERFLLAMPVLINVVLLAGFGSSLLQDRTPVVERFARLSEPDLSAEQRVYCRSVTKIWCWFFVINGSISLWLALFAPLTAWGLYTGAIAYVLMGTLFAAEYAVRKIRFG